MTILEIKILSLNTYNEYLLEGTRWDLKEVAIFPLNFIEWKEVHEYVISHTWS